MEGVNIKNTKIKKRLERISDLYFYKLPEEYQQLVKIVILRYRKYSDNEYYILFILIYWLVFFNIIDTDNNNLTQEDRENLANVKQSYLYDIQWEKEKYIESMIWLNDDLFQLKMVLKYTLIVSTDNYIKLVTNIDNYYTSIWYIIPYLTLRESKLLGFFQDIYFKKVYNTEYNETKNIYLEQVSQIELPWEYMIWIVNELSDLMSKTEVMWKIKIRKKSYFSLYNKMNRKNYNHFSDTIWVRIIFQKLSELKKFMKSFEDINICIQKKDYINSQKENGYQSMHYKYLSFYRNTEILVELQLRTQKMDNAIHKSRTLSHFNYTVKKNKWSPLFKEVIFWYQYMISLMNKNK